MLGVSDAAADAPDVLLVDCGGDVLQRMLMADLSFDRLAGLIITHAHPDHLWGAVGNSSPVLPKADHFITEAEFAQWHLTDAAIAEKPEGMRGMITKTRDTLDGLGRCRPPRGIPRWRRQCPRDGRAVTTPMSR